MEFKKMKKLTKIGGLLTAFLFGFMSCGTIQNVSDVEVEPLDFDEEVLNLERKFSVLDGEFLSEKKLLSVKECEDFCSEIEYKAAAPGIKKSVQARLFALEGCANLLLGKKNSAKLLYEKAETAFKGDVRSLILASRLNMPLNIEEKIAENKENELLILEKAIIAYNRRDYPVAVANFDNAFLVLNSFYRDAYGQLREKSWNLRSVESSDSDLKSKNVISVAEMISLTKSETQLLDPYCYGRNVSSSELFNTIAGSGLLNPVSKGLSAENSVSKTDAVTKKICARFFWNLSCAKKESLRKNSMKYSKVYGSSGFASPVPDVPADDADFDAVLGCVEKELLNLEDGVNFCPDKKISAVEFLESVKKIR